MSDAPTTPVPVEGAEALDVNTIAVIETPAEGPVTLSAAGAKLEPPADRDQIPEGAWICDMGTVHFAATEKNDGTCPLCGMALVLNGPAEAGGNAGDAEHGHGH